jgi:hypothetical protein
VVGTGTALTAPETNRSRWVTDSNAHGGRLRCGQASAIRLYLTIRTFADSEILGVLVSRLKQCLSERSRPLQEATSKGHIPM